MELEKLEFAASFASIHESLSNSDGPGGICRANRKTLEQIWKTFPKGGPLVKIRKYSGALCAVLGSVIIVTHAPAQSTYLYIAHAAPGRNVSATPAPNPEYPVDFSVNGICLAQGISFGEIRGPLSGPAGTYTVQFTGANSATPCKGNPVLSASVTLAPGATYFGVLTVDASNHVIGQIYSANLTPVDAGTGRFEVINATVDTLNTPLYNRNNGGLVGSLTVPASTIVDGFASSGIYTTHITDASNKVLVGPIDVQVEPRDSYLYVLAGSTTNQSVQLIGPLIIRGVF